MLGACTMQCSELREYSGEEQGRESSRGPCPPRMSFFQTAVQIHMKIYVRDLEPGSRKMQEGDSELPPCVQRGPTAVSGGPLGFSLLARPTSTLNLPFSPQLLLFLKEKQRQHKRKIWGVYNWLCWGQRGSAGQERSMK